MKSKILPLEPLALEIDRSKRRRETCVFTNGCFDILHKGHVRYLQHARSLGDRLVVGVNSDRSVRLIKGPGRPIQPEDDRAEILAALECVDYVTLFDDETPLRLIERIVPDILVKGGDWPVDRIVGRDVVERAGGKVLSIPYTEGYSTSRLIDRIRAGEQTPATS